MGAELPTREDLRRGMTVEVEQADADPDERLIGDIRVIRTDAHPRGASRSNSSRASSAG